MGRAHTEYASPHKVPVRNNVLSVRLLLSRPFVGSNFTLITLSLSIK